MVTDAAPSVSYPNKPVVKRPFCFFCTEGGAPRGSSCPWPWGLRGGQQRDIGHASPRPDPMSPKAAPPGVCPHRRALSPAPCLHGLPSEEPGSFRTSMELSHAPMQMGSWVPRGLGLEISFHSHHLSGRLQNPHAQGAPQGCGPLPSGSPTREKHCAPTTEAYKEPLFI